MGKRVKISLIIVAAVLIIIAFFIAISLFGNPVSSFLAKNSATHHIENNYPDQDLHISKVGYNPKFGEYYVKLESDSSIDTRFELTMNHFGKIKHDSYIDDVGGAMATYTRLDEEYWKQVDKVIESKDFPFNTTTVFGTVNVGKDSKPLTFDKVYTPEELGTQYGKIVIYLENKSVSIRFMKTALLELKTYFDSKDLHFRVIDLTLQGSAGSAKSIAIQNFSYTDITNEGLAKKLKKAVEDLQKYYEEQDKLKDAGVV